MPHTARPRASSAPAAFDLCAELVTEADGLLVTAGAGLGVDSGLPDFRGDHGLWVAYPALGRAGMGFSDISNPAAFRTTPRLAWGFFGHSLSVCRATVPGPAFGALRELAERMPHGAFVYTSNVDGQFQKAGFDPERVVECHGTIHQLQCLRPCSDHTWPADELSPVVDSDSGQWLGDLPRCPRCGELARPNALLFGDWGWIGDKTNADTRRINRWLRGVEQPLVIELGAGTAIPTARQFGEDHAWRLIRVNPREPLVYARGHVSLAMGASEAMSGIADALARRRSVSR